MCFSLCYHYCIWWHWSRNTLMADGWPLDGATAYVLPTLVRGERWAGQRGVVVCDTKVTGESQLKSTPRRSLHQGCLIQTTQPRRHSAAQQLQDAESRSGDSPGPLCPASTFHPCTKMPAQFCLMQRDKCALSCADQHWQVWELRADALVIATFAMFCHLALHGLMGT